MCASVCTRCSYASHAAPAPAPARPFATGGSTNSRDAGTMPSRSLDSQPPPPAPMPPPPPPPLSPALMPPPPPAPSAAPAPESTPQAEALTPPAHTHAHRGPQPAVQATAACRATAEDAEGAPASASYDCHAMLANAAMHGDHFGWHQDADPQTFPLGSAWTSQWGLYANRVSHVFAMWGGHGQQQAWAAAGTAHAAERANARAAACRPRACPRAHRAHAPCHAPLQPARPWEAA